ncbi:MAG: response regulator transcription factor [Clostridiales bacterium]|nr:response regulator transcription factor [Clostridiales bacterium]
MAKILIVDDERDIFNLIKRYAEREGYEAVGASDGFEAVCLCRENDFDIIIMDAVMPDMDGFTACKKIREFKDVPILMLSARGTEYDKLYGFDVGIDDYVVKPFSPKELMARVGAIVKRYKRNAPEKSDCLEFEGLKINTEGRDVFVDGEKAELTAKEFDLLMCLVKNKGKAMSRDQILNDVWGYDYYGEDRIADWQIKLLRNKLGKYRSFIHTLRGVGYKFEA